MQRPDWKAMTPAERADVVRPLVAERLTASEIARHFVGASRNAVIGVCHRNGLVLARSGSMPRESRPAPKARLSGQKREHLIATSVAMSPAASPAAPAPVAAPPPFESRDPVLFTETVANQCRWPLWGHNERPKADAMFVCGAPTPDGRPYCTHHAEKARGEGMPCERRAVRAAMAVRG